MLEGDEMQQMDANLLDYVCTLFTPSGCFGLGMLVVITVNIVSPLLSSFG